MREALPGKNYAVSIPISQCVSSFHVGLLLSTPLMKMSAE